VSLNPAVLFHEDVLRAVDHDVRDARFFKQQFQRTEAERFVEDFFDQTFPFRPVEQCVFGITKVFDHEPNLTPQRVTFEVTQSRQIEFLDQLAVDRFFERFKLDVLFVSAGLRLVGCK
jgi:hypothetical protein